MKLIDVLPCINYKETIIVKSKSNNVLSIYNGYKGKNIDEIYNDFEIEQIKIEDGNIMIHIDCSEKAEHIVEILNSIETENGFQCLLTPHRLDALYFVGKITEREHTILTKVCYKKLNMFYDKMFEFERTSEFRTALKGAQEFINKWNDVGEYNYNMRKYDYGTPEEVKERSAEYNSLSESEKLALRWLAFNGDISYDKISIYTHLDRAEDLM